MFRLYIALFPYSHYKKQLVIVDAPPAPKGLAKWVGRCVFIASRHVPYSTCLSRALTARFVLKSKGYGSTIRVGVAQADGAVTAHAWVLSGDLIVVGAEGHDLERYKVITEMGRKS